MDREAHRFADRMGLLFEREGLSPTAGRICGWLLLAEEPVSLDDLAKALDTSKASASTNTRFLEHTGLIERVGVRGSRKAYYRIANDVWLTVTRNSFRQLETFIEMARDGQERIAPHNKTAARRLREMEITHKLLKKHLQAFLHELEEALRKDT